MELCCEFKQLTAWWGQTVINLLEDFKMRKRRSLAALKANLLSDYTDFIDGVSAKQIYLFVIDSFKTMVSLLMCLESLTISNTWVDTRYYIFYYLQFISIKKHLIPIKKIHFNSKKLFELKNSFISIKENNHFGLKKTIC